MGRLEQQQRFVDESNQVDPIPDDISITELAEDVVRGKRKRSQPQMRMLIELLPYYAPKLTAVAVGWVAEGRGFLHKVGSGGRCFGESKADRSQGD